MRKMQREKEKSMNSKTNISELSATQKNSQSNNQNSKKIIKKQIFNYIYHQIQIIQVHNQYHN